MTEATLHLPDEMQHITLHVRITGRAQFRARVWAGIKLMQLASFIIGCNVDVKDQTDQKGPLQG